MPLSFKPACLPVAHSGLPHSSASQALGLLMTTIPTVLTWPQLPSRLPSEQKFVRSISNFPGLVVDNQTEAVYVDRTSAEQDIDKISLAYLKNTSAIGALNAESASGLVELLTVPRGWFEGVAITTYLIGPISLGLHLTDEQQRSLMYDPILLEAMTQLLALRVAWVSAQLANLTDNCIICLEEPFLDAINSPFFPIDWDRGIELLEVVFAGVQGCRGISLGNPGLPREHTSSVYWAPLLDTSVEMLAFNVYSHSDVLIDSASILGDFLNRPGFLIWGLVPTSEEALAVETVDTLARWFHILLGRLVAAGLSREQVLQASLISTSGSLAHLSIRSAEQALQLCSDVSQRLRLVYGVAPSE